MLPCVLLIKQLGYLVHLAVSGYSANPAIPQRARQTDCINERELSALLTFSNLFCMCIAHPDPLCRFS